MKKEYYRQCEFQSDDAQLVAWVEEKKAKLGHKVTFKDHDDPNRWWEIISVGATRLPKEQARARQREHMKLKEKTK